MSQKEFSDLMHTHAEDAKKYIQGEYNINLDYSEHCLEHIDSVLNRITENGLFYTDNTEQSIP